MRHRPCGDCPWRKDAPRGVWSKERWRSLAATCRGDGMAIFACHNTPPENPAICAGWAAVEGDGAPGVRLALFLGLFDPTVLSTRGLTLFDSFDEMLSANGITDAPSGRAHDGCDNLRRGVLARLSRRRGA